MATEEHEYGGRPQLLGEPLGILEDSCEPLGWFQLQRSEIDKFMVEFGEDLDRHLAESSNDLKRLIPGGF